MLTKFILCLLTVVLPTLAQLEQIMTTPAGVKREASRLRLKRDAPGALA